MYPIHLYPLNLYLINRGELIISFNGPVKRNRESTIENMQKNGVVATNPYIFATKCQKP